MVMAVKQAVSRVRTKSKARRKGRKACVVEKKGIPLTPAGKICAPGPIRKLMGKKKDK